MQPGLQLSPRLWASKGFPHRLAVLFKSVSFVYTHLYQLLYFSNFSVLYYRHPPVSSFDFQAKRILLMA